VNATAADEGWQLPRLRRPVMSDAVSLAAGDTGLRVTDGTRVAFHPLSIRSDGDRWVIGRIDTGDFAAMPPVARRAIALLSDAHTVGEVARALRQETGKEIAVADFVAELDRLGFLSAIDSQPRGGPRPIRASLPWLRPQHVRWLLHPVLPWLVLGIIAAAAALVIADPAVLPGYRDLVWSRHSGMVLVVNATIGWTLVWLHELGHLATARAAGVPARLSLGTRLQFLAAQTDVSGIWAAPRVTRLTVYLAGIAVDLVTASACLLVIGLAHPVGLTRQLLSVVVLEAVVFLPLEFLIFMRTDVYFLVQDLAGCANLYADGSARVRYLAQRMRHPGGRGSSAPSDPGHALPARERRAVSAYCWLLLCGTTGCLAAAVFITVPAAIVLIAHAVGEMASPSPTEKTDGAAAFAACCGFQIVWLRTWWRRHGGRVSAFLRTWQRRAAGGR
jgi:putative peptide zinc metalloprotease protein